jgi:hypothetical protein
LGQRDEAGFAAQPRASECSHPEVISTVTAGIERVVCQMCHHVSIRYSGATVRIWPEAPVPSPDSDPDMVVDLTTRYYTPSGLACNVHAWEAASAQEGMGADFWIPLLIERDGPHSR